MAGGLFPGYPFAPNWKCVWFTAILAGGYWWLPPRRPLILLALLILPYIAMAWYDYYYQCKQKLKPTLVPFGRTLFLPFKPPDYQAEFSTMPPQALRTMDSLDHITAWILCVVVGVVVVYAGRK